LNNRLDKFLIDHGIIHESQIGFSKKSRTSNHLFVLKCLIDKYINTESKRLYTCFVDCHKAFDTVINAGIQYKLLQCNFNGIFIMCYVVCMVEVKLPHDNFVVILDYPTWKWVWCTPLTTYLDIFQPWIQRFILQSVHLLYKCAIRIHFCFIRTRRINLSYYTNKLFSLRINLLVPVSYLSAPSAVHSYRVPGKFIRRLKSLFV
jgi:hypothetical protein